MPELRRVDSAFVIISSHGTGKLGQQETEVLGIDYKSAGYKNVVCTKILNYFTAENCRNLAGKPKIFIFQTCRYKKFNILNIIQKSYLHIKKKKKKFPEEKTNRWQSLDTKRMQQVPLQSDQKNITFISRKL